MGAAGRRRRRAGRPGSARGGWASGRGKERGGRRRRSRSPGRGEAGGAARCCCGARCAGRKAARGPRGGAGGCRRRCCRGRGGPFSWEPGSRIGSCCFLPLLPLLSSPPSSSSSPKPGEEACSQSLAAPVLLGSLLPGLVRGVIGLRDFLCAFFVVVILFSFFSFPFPFPVAHRMLGSGWILPFIFGGAARRGEGSAGMSAA